MHFAHLHDTSPASTTSIFSRTGGIVAWKCNVERATEKSESVEIHASHFGLSENPVGLNAIADRVGNCVSMEAD